MNAAPDPARTRDQTITLHQFELAGTDVGAAQPEDGAAWVPAVVPGGVHESLLAAGLIEDPFRDRQERDVRWIEERDWWYRTRFAAPTDLAPDERLRLVCWGLDTVAELWLNGERLGAHANMFRPALFDITGAARADNSLVVRFSPPLAGLEQPEPARLLTATLAEVMGGLVGEAPTGSTESDDGPMLFSDTLAKSTLRRKATFSWGWDFGPRVPSVGIWRPVELVRERRAALSGHHVRASAVDPAGATAEVEVDVEVEAFATEHALVATVVLTSPSGTTTSTEVPLPTASGSRRSGRGHLHVDRAELWWTHDLGDQPLYDVQITLREETEVLDQVHDRIGLRTIELDRSPDPEGGRHFRFVLNGHPLFARGAAWLPASQLVGAVPEQRYRDLVTTARDGNMTMLRVWGGGIYEDDAFYAATDELGVLVWQDFMFACTDYPSEDAELAGEVAEEAAYQVARLRNRASIAVWAGNNEVHMIHHAAYGDTSPGNWGYDFFHRLLPDTVAALAPGVPYWPGSPYGEDDPNGVNGVLDGDRHAWEVWHGLDFGTGDTTEYASHGEAMHFWRYAHDRGKFISEFGIHASPELDTLRRWLPDDQLWVHSPAFDAHNKDHPKNKGDALLEVETGLPDGIEQYVQFTMATQAEGLKFGVEHYRRRQPSTSGTLVWQFNDVWPGFSWSVVDFDLVPKAGYYYLKRAYAPVLASFCSGADGLQLWVANSTAATVTTEALVELASFDGTLHLQATVPVTVPPASAALVWSAPASAVATDRFAWVSSPLDTFPANRLFFDHLKNLPLPDPRLEVAVARRSPTSATVTVTASTFAHLVHVPSPAPGVRFSDNYLDLRAGDRAVITLEGLPDGLDLSRLTVATYRDRQPGGGDSRAGAGEH